MKEVAEIEPTSIEHTAVRKRLEKFADVLMPADAAAPILAPAVRSALYDWMTEINLAEELTAVDVKPRRSALLYGPPGAGKTTFAHHFAARLGMPLALVRSESIIECWVGSTGRNIGQLFDAMKATEGQVVIFLDEVDALGVKRMNDQGASVERSNSLNVLLRRIEQFEGIALAATNRQDALDPALWRRFDMQIEIALPGPDERFAIMRRYFSPFDPPDDDLDLLVKLTDGASPALLRGVAEGLKRSLVLWPRMRRAISDPVALFAAVIASVAPPPEFEPPKLWSDPAYVSALTALTWPWSLSSAAE